jgi:hypothetical protein
MRRNALIIEKLEAERKINQIVGFGKHLHDAKSRRKFNTLHLGQ